MIVYKITNKVNGKVYIGQTVYSIDRRWKQHKRVARTKPNIFLYKAINKYGPDSFSVEELYKASSVEELNDKEKEFIAVYKATDPTLGYNGTFGGNNGIPTNEVKARVSAAKRHRDARRPGEFSGERNPNYGRKHTPEELKKMSTSRIGKKSKRGSSLFVGVRACRKNNNWKVVIRIDGKERHVGTFPTEFEAALAYDTAVTKHYGPEQRRNFPLGQVTRVEMFSQMGD